MTITKPEYYDSFHCIAGACPDSCCREWEVQVDAAAAAYYRGLPGALGDDLRSVLREEDGEVCMTIVEGRCPMWRQDGLCRIQAELGEEALCTVCREFPRLRHEYGELLELGLELSCPEAARLILNAQPGERIAMQTEEVCEDDCDTEALELLLASRRQAMVLLDGSLPASQALALLLLYGYQAQAELDGEPQGGFDRAAGLQSCRELAKPGDAAGIREFFLQLELLTPQWEQLLRSGAQQVLPDLALARYLVDRYWLQAISDYDLVCRVKLIVISCLLVSLLGGGVQTAQLFSKEIENDADNVDAILDAAYTCPAFADAGLLGLLLTEDENHGE